MSDDILNELKKISYLLEKQLDSNKYIERRLFEVIASPFGLRSSFALNKSKFFLDKKNTIKIGYGGKDVFFCLPKAYQDFIQQKILIDESFYELDLLQKVCARDYSGMEILDVGANIGNHSIFFAMFSGAAKVVSFEPQNDVRNIFNKNLLLNSLSNVVVFPYAVGAKCGFAGESHFSNINSGAVSFRDSCKGRVPMRSIDSLGLSPALIKIDVEGAELEVIKGAVKTIRECHPDIWVECFDSRLFELEKIMADMGYVRLLSMSGSNYLYVFSK